MKKARTKTRYFYKAFEDDLDSRAILNLPDRTFKILHFLKCVTSRRRTEVLPLFADLAHLIRYSEADLAGHIEILLDQGFVTKTKRAGESVHIVVGFEEYRMVSPSTDRVRKHRSKAIRDVDGQSDDEPDMKRFSNVSETVIPLLSSRTTLVDSTVLPRRKGTVLDDRDVPIAACGHAYVQACTDGRRHGHADVGTGTDGHTHTDGHGCEHGRACHDIDADRQAIVDEKLADAKQRRREGQP